MGRIGRVAHVPSAVADEMRADARHDRRLCGIDRVSLKYTDR